MDMVVEKKWRAQEANGKMQNANGPNASFLKNVPTHDNSTVELKSDQHMLLPYRPFMKYLHPRAGDKMTSFEIDGSMLTYRPMPHEFMIDKERMVSYDNESKHQLMFKMEEGETEDSDVEGKTLWYCTSLQSGKADQLLRCEEVGSSNQEDIPVQRLMFATRKCDDKCSGLYSPSAHAAAMSSGMHKTGVKKHGKSEAHHQENIHTSYPHHH